MLGETRLDETQRSIGFLDARPIGRIDPDDELRHIRAGEQAESDDRNGRGDDRGTSPSAASTVVFGLASAQRNAGP